MKDLTRLGRLCPLFSLGCLFFVSSAAPAVDVNLPADRVAVYWDIHPVNIGIATAYTPSGRYSPLVDLLDPLGFDVTESTDLIDLEALSRFNIMVLADGSDGLDRYTSSELVAIESFVHQGGGLLIMTDVFGSSGTARMQDVTALFGVEISQARFQAQDILSSRIEPHPAVDGVDEIFLRFSSPITSTGVLMPYAYSSQGEIMLAAGEVGKGRVVVIADGDLFTAAPGIRPYIDRASNRQLAASTFRYLAIPEPSTLAMGIGALLFVYRMRH